jgi:hypothetical protein
MQDSVVIEYGNDSMEIDLENLNSMDDFVAVVAMIKPQKVVSVDFANPDEGFMKFDELTICERGMINFLNALEDKIKSISDSMVPLSERRLAYAADVLGASDHVKKSSVDPFAYANLAKLTLLETLVETHCQIMLHSRLGYDVFTQVGEGGVIYVIRDLRKLFVT